MAASVIATEWQNQNSLRNYPFREDCGLRPNDSAGNLIQNGFRLPNHLLVDMVVGVSSAPYDPTAYLKRMSVVDGSVTLVFADRQGADAFTVGATLGESVKELSGVGSFADARGAVVFGDLERFFSDVPDGLYVFSMSETLVEPTCIRPSAAGVRSIAAVDASGYRTEGLQGDVNLIAGDNVHIRYDKPTNSLIVSADPDSGYTDGCECEGTENMYVRSINGIRTSDVTIVGDDCVSVTTENGVITISDTCSKPCCGCAETAFINQTINDLRSSVSTLSTNAAILADRITTFVNNYLLSRKTLA
jgi:hypothetical protein